MLLLSHQTDKAGLVLTTDDQGNILFNNDPVLLRGVNWFGFDDGNTVFDGLYQGTLLPPNENAGNPTNYDDGLTREFFTVMHRIQILGFNTIRVPFSFVDLFTLTPKSYTVNCQLATDADLRQYTTEPGFDSSNVPLPPLVALPAAADGYKPGLCNNYLDPSSSPKDPSAPANPQITDTFSRLVYMVKYLANNNFFVVLTDQSNIDRTAVNDYQGWQDGWTRLVRDISADSVAATRLMIDPINEPDAFAMRWEDDPSNTITTRGYATYLFALMNQVNAINPNVLLFVEGAGQQGPQGPARNYGDGLATDPTVVQQLNYAGRPISDASVFFGPLLSKSYLRQIVVAPHLYPPSISQEDTTVDSPLYKGAGLWKRLSDSFGYLNQAPGFCLPGTKTCSIFPVVIAEVGSSFKTTTDNDFMTDFSTYLRNIAPADDGRHAAVRSILWYAWNSNAGTTGGIVNGDPESCVAYSSGATACNSDWLQVDWEGRYAYLQTLGVVPWYRPGYGADSGIPNSALASPAA
ncbi:hypothetical protein WJX72_007450 [[Myrmecia] bisecta]|uniref:Glycoside hydrolase family 5 domain-containing protein n=1 Tax=[Myrmecia] bisecta TaxID=41462 RepID=A0AAW1PN36_9CHLO